MLRLSCTTLFMLLCVLAILPSTLAQQQLIQQFPLGTYCYSNTNSSTGHVSQYELIVEEHSTSINGHCVVPHSLYYDALAVQWFRIINSSMFISALSPCAPFLDDPGQVQQIDIDAHGGIPQFLSFTCNSSDEPNNSSACSVCYTFSKCADVGRPLGEVLLSMCPQSTGCPAHLGWNFSKHVSIWTGVSYDGHVFDVDVIGFFSSAAGADKQDSGGVLRLDLLNSSFPLRSLRAANNQLRGCLDLCSLPATLSELDVSNNSLGGAPDLSPVCIANLTRLLDLRQNRLSGATVLSGFPSHPGDNHSSAIFMLGGNSALSFVSSECSVLRSHGVIDSWQHCVSADAIPRMSPVAMCGEISTSTMVIFDVSPFASEVLISVDQAASVCQHLENELMFAHPVLAANHQYYFAHQRQILQKLAACLLGLSEVASHITLDGSTRLVLHSDQKSLTLERSDAKVCGVAGESFSLDFSLDKCTTTVAPPQQYCTALSSTANTFLQTTVTAQSVSLERLQVSGPFRTSVECSFNITPILGPDGVIVVPQPNNTSSSSDSNAEVIFSLPCVFEPIVKMRYIVGASAKHTSQRFELEPQDGASASVVTLDKGSCAASSGASSSAVCEQPLLVTSSAATTATVSRQCAFGSTSCADDAVVMWRTTDRSSGTSSGKLANHFQRTDGTCLAVSKILPASFFSESSLNHQIVGSQQPPECANAGAPDGSTTPCYAPSCGSAAAWVSAQIRCSLFGRSNGSSALPLYVNDSLSGNKQQVAGLCDASSAAAASDALNRLVEFFFSPSFQSKLVSFSCLWDSNTSKNYVVVSACVNNNKNESLLVFPASDSSYFRCTVCHPYLLEGAVSPPLVLTATFAVLRLLVSITYIVFLSQWFESTVKPKLREMRIALLVKLRCLSRSPSLKADQMQFGARPVVTIFELVFCDVATLLGLPQPQQQSSLEPSNVVVSGGYGTVDGNNNDDDDDGSNTNSNIIDPTLQFNYGKDIDKTFYDFYFAEVTHFGRRRVFAHVEMCRDAVVELHTMWRDEYVPAVEATRRKRKQRREQEEKQRQLQQQQVKRKPSGTLTAEMQSSQPTLRSEEEDKQVTVAAAAPSAAAAATPATSAAAPPAAEEEALLVDNATDQNLQNNSNNTNNNATDDEAILTKLRERIQEMDDGAFFYPVRLQGTELDTVFMQAGFITWGTNLVTLLFIIFAATDSGSLDDSVDGQNVTLARILHVAWSVANSSSSWLNALMAIYNVYADGGRFLIVEFDGTVSRTALITVGLVALPLPFAIVGWLQNAACFVVFLSWLFFVLTALLILYKCGCLALLGPVDRQRPFSAVEQQENRARRIFVRVFVVVVLFTTASFLLAAGTNYFVLAFSKGKLFDWSNGFETELVSEEFARRSFSCFVGHVKAEVLRFWSFLT